MILPFSFLRRSLHRRLCRIQHIFDKYSVTRGEVIDKHVGDRAHVLTVLDYGATAHECGQEGTTNFVMLFIKFLAASSSSSVGNRFGKVFFMLRASYFEPA